MNDSLGHFQRITAELRAIQPQVVIVAVLKKQPLDKIRPLLTLPQVHLANNYVQEGETAREALAGHPQIQWHFIGHIQSRKAKDLVSYDWIQSLDRIEVAEKLESRLAPLSKTLNCLVEINIGNEATKSGISLEQGEDFISRLQTLRHLRVRGLMVMPPPLSEPEQRRPFFQQTHREFNRLRTRFNLDTLSMGTSEDYRIAVEEGSTMVRLGTSLFGPR